MKKAKVFYGEPKTGKTRKANELAFKLNGHNGSGSKCTIFDGTKFKPQNKQMLKRIPETCELIIIDEVTLSFNWESVFSLIDESKYDFIFTTNQMKFPKNESFNSRFELVEFK